MSSSACKQNHHIWLEWLATSEAVELCSYTAYMAVLWFYVFRLWHRYLDTIGWHWWMSVLFGYWTTSLAIHLPLGVSHCCLWRQNLESLSFGCHGDEFISAHIDGSYILWSLSDAARPKCEPVTPYGLFINASFSWHCECCADICCLTELNLDFLFVGYFLQTVLTCKIDIFWHRFHF